MISALAISLALFAADLSAAGAFQPPSENDELPADDYDYTGLETLVFEDDPDEPLVPQGTVDPSIPRDTVRLAGGRARVTFRAPIRIIVRPRLLIHTLPSRVATSPSGATFEGPDENNNGMPDDLERPDVQVLPAN